MDNSNVFGPNGQADEPEPTSIFGWPDIKTDNVLAALTARVRFAIVASWLPPASGGEATS